MSYGAETQLKEDLKKAYAQEARELYNSVGYYLYKNYAGKKNDTAGSSANQGTHISCSLKTESTKYIYLSSLFSLQWPTWEIPLFKDNKNYLLYADQRTSGDTASVMDYKSVTSLFTIQLNNNNHTIFFLKKLLIKYELFKLFPTLDQMADKDIDTSIYPSVLSLIDKTAEALINTDQEANSDLLTSIINEHDNEIDQKLHAAPITIKEDSALLAYQKINKIKRFEYKDLQKQLETTLREQGILFAWASEDQIKKAEASWDKVAIFMVTALAWPATHADDVESFLEESKNGEWLTPAFSSLFAFAMMYMFFYGLYYTFITTQYRKIHPGHHALYDEQHMQLLKDAHEFALQMAFNTLVLNLMCNFVENEEVLHLDATYSIYLFAAIPLFMLGIAYMYKDNHAVTEDNTKYYREQSKNNQKGSTHAEAFSYHHHKSCILILGILGAIAYAGTTFLEEEHHDLAEPLKNVITLLMTVAAYQNSCASSKPLLSAREANANYQASQKASPSN